MREETLVTNILKYKKVIEGMLTAMTGDYCAAEDLFQEMAVIMTRRREEADEDCRFVAWARGIGVNLVRDWRKKKARQKVRLLDDQALESVAMVFEETDEPLWEVRREALKSCTEALPGKERAILKRRYEEAEPIETMASALAMTRGAVDTLLYRIRKSLVNCVELRLGKLGLL